MRQEKYNYHSLSIPGGGFVTGMLFHPKKRGLLYARTDVGGIYRYDPKNESWLPIMDWVDGEHEAYMQVMSIALDEEHPERLFAACGNEWPGCKKMPFLHESALLYSEDYGQHFSVKPLPFMVNGNGPTRSCAEKLEYVDGKLYYASADEGLFCSPDMGEHWESIPVPNPHLVFVHVDRKRHWILLSCTGEPIDLSEAYATAPAEATQKENSPKLPQKDNDFYLAPRENSLYLAVDGYDFHPLPTPQWPQEYMEKPAGYVAVSRAISESENAQEIYVTFSCAGRQEPRHPYDNFSCECGGGTHGRLLRYKLPLDGSLEHPDTYEDLTPPIPEGAGMCGIAVCGDMIYCSTINERYNYIYRSMDRGESYQEVLNPIAVETMDFDVPYMKPEYNNDIILVHWMSCLLLDPFSPDFLVFNTGTGVFASFSASKEKPHFKTLSAGIEETVHLNLYAPPAGDVKVLDVVGDLGGFAFRDFAGPCENSFADEENHRYITCNNADYTDTPVKISAPNLVQTGQLPYIATARGNWTGHTEGGLILSLDDCKTFKHLPMPYGLSLELDEVCRRIEKPNVNAGWCAMSSDGKVILWTLAERWFHLPVRNAVRTDDYGETYQPVEVYDKDGNQLVGVSDREVKLFADRVNPNWFYGFGERGQVYFSGDKGRSFHECVMPDDFPVGFYLSGVDGMKISEVRCEAGKMGSVWMACEKYGLWHLTFSEKCVNATRIENSTVYRVGLGRGHNPDYPALYICGYIEGKYGFYRKNAPDDGWARINTGDQMYGGISAISGDLNVLNRVYIATTGRGLFWGETE